MTARSPDGPRPPRTPSAAEARAEVEARRVEARAEQRAAFAAAYDGAVPGRWVIAGSWAVTAGFLVATLVAVSLVGSAVTWYVAASLTLFAVGCLLFGLDVVLAAARSRDAAIGIGGLFFLAGSAPPAVRGHLLGSLASQVMVAVIAAVIGFVRIDTRELNALAFGILVPVLGLASCGFWAVRWGLFPEHAPVSRDRSRR